MYIEQTVKATLTLFYCSKCDSYQSRDGNLEESACTQCQGAMQAKATQEVTFTFS